jgi:hypothetical protein
MDATECDPFTYEAHCDGNDAKSCQECGSVQRLDCTKSGGQVCVKRDSLVGCALSPPTSCEHGESGCFDDGTGYWYCDPWLLYRVVRGTCVSGRETCVQQGALAGCVLSPPASCAPGQSGCFDDHSGYWVCDRALYYRTGGACDTAREVCAQDPGSEAGCVDAALTPCNSQMTTCSADASYTLRCDTAVGYLTPDGDCAEGLACVQTTAFSGDCQ